MTNVIAVVECSIQLGISTASLRLNPFGNEAVKIMEASDVVDPRSLLGDFQRSYWYPCFRRACMGPWAMRVIEVPALRGYWGKVYGLTGTVILEGPGRSGRGSWMSITPSEIESQEIGLAAAHGHTVVMGFGMGWLAGNVALKPEVERVTVVERDRDILALAELQNLFGQLPQTASRKIEIVQADALKWRPDSPVDTLQADIWEHYLEDQKLDDVRRMQENVAAKSIYFWGQEMEIWRASQRRSGTLNGLRIRQIVEGDIALPLILPDWPDYPEKIAAAAEWWYRTTAP